MPCDILKMKSIHNFDIDIQYNLQVYSFQNENWNTSDLKYTVNILSSDKLLIIYLVHHLCLQKKIFFFWICNLCFIRLKSCEMTWIWLFDDICKLTIDDIHDAWLCFADCVPFLNDVNWTFFCFFLLFSFQPLCLNIV